MLSVLILMISQSVIRCSGSPHCGFLNPFHPPLKRMTCTQCSSQYTMQELLRHHSYCTVLNLYWALWCHSYCTVLNLLSIVTSFISHRTKSVLSTLYVSKWNLQILLLNINNLFNPFWMIFNSRPSLGFIVRIEKLMIVLFKMCFALVNKCCIVDPRHLFLKFFR